MTELLFDDSPLTALPRVAKEIGLHEAMVLQQMHYWLNPTRNKHFKENRCWVRNSYVDCQEQIRCISAVTIKRAIRALEKREILISRNFSAPFFSRIKWYTINYEKLMELHTFQNPQQQNFNTEKDYE